MEIACRLKYSRNGASSDRAAPAFSWRSAAKRAWRRLAKGRRKLAVRLARRVTWVSLQVRRRVLRVASAAGDYHEVGDHQPLRYDMLSYAKNFDDGEWRQEEEEYYSSRSFASRFGRAVDESTI
ncbi:Eukaryotic translation initiation factor 6 (eIF-6) [Psidium guajava]|nr:Eukaryotic translation initiation factor 6 (eIF-6) [Psidium guajava]